MSSTCTYLMHLYYYIVYLYCTCMLEDNVPIASESQACHEGAVAAQIAATCLVSKTMAIYTHIEFVKESGDDVIPQTQVVAWDSGHESAETQGDESLRSASE